jgi:predicted DNA-binding antitoxin AbrB/MazE fold protein
MASVPKLRARYSKGKLELLDPLKLPEGTQVIVSVRKVKDQPKNQRAAKRKYIHPNRPLPAGTLSHLVGLVALGGDAVADSEAIYDE